MGEAIKAKSTMRRLLTLFITAVLCVATAAAQTSDADMDQFNVTTNTFNPNAASDSLKAGHKKVPKGIRLWTIDERFGDASPVVRDTLQHLFMNSVFTSGKYGEYNTTGNLGSPRIARIATDRDFSMRDALLEPYGFFITKPGEQRYTNTLSPITNLSYFSCGNKTNGEDYLRALFATNANKDIGFGFKFNYLYGRGYYASQNISLFDYTMWGSYIGERYNAHLALTFNHMKTSENGGIKDDDYITHPEKYTDQYDQSEIPTILSNNYNFNDAFRATFSHRYNIGFYRKVPMTEMEKEAKRFALKAQAAKEAKEAAAAKLKGEDAATAASRNAFAGRPDDAVIAGDLPTDGKKPVKNLADSLALAAADSLAAKSKAAAPDTSWLKDEYVPVTSFIHTLQLANNHHSYVSNSTQSGFYLHRYAVPSEAAPGDSINDKLKYLNMRNTFAVGLLEGFNKYVPMGLKVFLTHELRRYILPDENLSYTTYAENNVSVGGQIIKSLGAKIHYCATGEFTLVGADVGNVLIDGDGDLNLRMLGDTAQVKLKAFYHLTTPAFLQRRYHSKFFSWDNGNFNKQMQTHLEASFRLARTKTALRACYDNIQNLAYLAVDYNIAEAADGTRTYSDYTASPRQTSANISLFTLALEQNFRVGILNWENRLTLQKSTQQEILPVPTFNAWTNLYLNFRIARVLRVHFGAEGCYFTSYNAPEYVPALGQYAVQTNAAVRTSVGGYPLVNVYANFQLKKCRFFLMMSHLNAGTGNKNYFLTPHHPLNGRVLRFGISWDFHN